MFFKLTADQLAHVRLTCCNQGRVVRKPVNANTGSRVNQSINFSCISFLVFHCFCSVLFEIVQTQNGRPNNINSKPNQSSNQNFGLSKVSLMGL